MSTMGMPCASHERQHQVAHLPRAQRQHARVPRLALLQFQCTIVPVRDSASELRCKVVAADARVAACAEISSAT